MAFLQANIYSNVLEMEMNVNVILPQETVKKVGTSTQAALTDIPVLYGRKSQRLGSQNLY